VDHSSRTLSAARLELRLRVVARGAERLHVGLEVGATFRERDDVIPDGRRHHAAGGLAAHAQWMVLE